MLTYFDKTVFSDTACGSMMEKIKTELLQWMHVLHGTDKTIGIRIYTDNKIVDFIAQDRNNGLQSFPYGWVELTKRWAQYL